MKHCGVNYQISTRQGEGGEKRRRKRGASSTGVGKIIKTKRCGLERKNSESIKNKISKILRKRFCGVVRWEVRGNNEAATEQHDDALPDVLADLGLSGDDFERFHDHRPVNGGTPIF